MNSILELEIKRGIVEFNFRQIQREDFPLLQKWQAEPHVQKWWHENLNLVQIEEKYGPRVDGTEPTYVYLILRHLVPIGLIQWYRWSDYPKHASQVGADLEAAGIDLAIGEVDMIGKGFGAKIITQFLNQIIFAESDVKTIITDPEESNISSLKAFQKAGFIFHNIVQLENESNLRQTVIFKKRV